MAYKAKCEHCGTRVEVAQVCGQCGRDHSGKWIEQHTSNKVFNDIAEIISSIFVIFITVSFFISVFSKVS